VEPVTFVCHTVLVIEDDEPILFAIQETLALEGYKVVTAMDGKKGLAILHTVEPPCLILLDLMLPIMNGWEFLDQLKKEGDTLAAIPVVIASAAGKAALTATKRAQGYIKKPIDLELLLTTVRKFCGPPYSS